MGFIGLFTYATAGIQRQSAVFLFSIYKLWIKKVNDAANVLLFLNFKYVLKHIYTKHGIQLKTFTNKTLFPTNFQ